ncbi:MAG: DNA primase [Defluviitaleaceae bacterium]|nr:DNA primase [Defluviitaleaceae bacterium]
MFYPEHIVEDIREQNDIVELISAYTNLKARGNSYVGLCPFHNESTPSFTVNPGKQLYHCFGCGVGGNAYSFVMAIEGLGFTESIEHLAHRINYVLPQKGMQQDSHASSEKDILYKINAVAADFFYENLKNSTITIDYLKERGITPQIAKKFKLGYSLPEWDKLYNYLQNSGYPQNFIEKAGLVALSKNGKKYYDRFRGRLMFPIFEPRGKVIGFGGRSLGDEMPKYINSPETIIYNKSNSLYALNFVKKGTDKDIIVVEGYMDAIALYQAGFYGVVASLGTAFTSAHGRLISRYGRGVILVFDSDTAGLAAAMRTINDLKTSGISIKILSLKNAKDPDEYLKKFPKEDFLQEIKKAKNYIDFQIENLLQDHSVEDTQSKIDFTKQATAIIAHIKDPVEKDAYTNHISEITGIDSASIKTQLDTIVVQTPVKKPIFVKQGQQALKEAKANLISALANSYAVYTALLPHLQPQEMDDEIYTKMLQILYDFYEKDETVNPARLLNHFADTKDQSIVAGILSIEPNLDKKYLSKAINDQAKLIKKAYIENQLESSDSLVSIQQLVNSRNSVENLNIAL